MVAWHDRQRLLLGLEHADPVPLGRRDDPDRPRDAGAAQVERRRVRDCGSAAAEKLLHDREGANRRRRPRLGRPGHRGLLRRARPPRRRARDRHGEGRRTAGGRACRSTSRASPRSSSETPSGSSSRPSSSRCATARLAFICVGTPRRPHSGDADLSAVHAAVEELSASGDGPALVMKSTVPGRAPGARSAERARAFAYVSCPEFLREGTAVKDFLEPDRVVIGADPGDEEAADAVAAVYEPLGGADRPHRRRQRRDDQARLQRLPRHQDQLHQRDRQRLRRGRRRRHRGRARDGPRPADRRPLPQRRPRLRRKLLPQGHPGAEASSPATPATTSSC